MVLAPKRTFSFRRTSRAWRLFELVVQGWLEEPDVKHVLAQRDRSGVRGDEVADDLGLSWRAISASICRSRAPQYDRMIAENLGELDKSGIAELTFKDRHKHSGDRV